jgi:5-methylcytosine-specific restriction endonuclease McrA
MTDAIENQIRHLRARLIITPDCLKHKIRHNIKYYEDLLKATQGQQSGTTQGQQQGQQQHSAFFPPSNTNTNTIDSRYSKLLMVPLTKKAVVQLNPETAFQEFRNTSPISTTIQQPLTKTIQQPLTKATATATAKATTSSKKKKKPISATVKRLVWNANIGEEIGKSKCLCCHSTDITQLSFHCGHIVAESNGGELIVSNLRPICQNCNSSMGTKNMNDFMKTLL